jgi:hypothetical protein
MPGRLQHSDGGNPARTDFIILARSTPGNDGLEVSCLDFPGVGGPIFHGFY